MLTLVCRSASALRRSGGRISQHLMLALMVTFGLATCMAPAEIIAQNLGTAPAVGKAVQGQTASQPEGAFLNIGNVICPVGAVLALVTAIVQWGGARGWISSLFKMPSIDTGITGKQPKRLRCIPQSTLLERTAEPKEADAQS